MKTKFYLLAMAFAAITFTACEGDKPNDPTATFEVSYQKNGQLVKIENGAKIETSEKNDMNQIIVEGAVKNLSEEDGVFKLKAIREYDLTLASDEICSGVNCFPGNGEKEQIFDLAELAKDEEETFSTHLGGKTPGTAPAAGSYNIKYEVYAEGNEADKISFTVTYKVE